MNESIGEFVQVGLLTPHPKNPRHNDQAVESIANSIKRFGFTSPIIANMDQTILCGHTRYKAARSLGLSVVPVIYVDLSPVDAELLMIADNKLGEKAEWNTDQLSELLIDLREQGEDLDVLGFEDHELSDLLDDIHFDEISEDFTETDLDFVYQIMIEDLNENQQAELILKLETEGWKCRALIV